MWMPLASGLATGLGRGQSAPRENPADRVESAEPDSGAKILAPIEETLYSPKSRLTRGQGHKAPLPRLEFANQTFSRSDSWKSPLQVRMENITDPTLEPDQSNDPSLASHSVVSNCRIVFIMSSRQHAAVWVAQAVRVPCRLAESIHSRMEGE